MQSTIQEKLFAMVRYELAGTPIPAEHVPSEDELADIYTLASRHDIAQLPAAVIEETGWLNSASPLAAKYAQQLLLAVSRVVNLEHELSAISAVLEEAGIPFVPLKGALLRTLYPESWMRTSCDIDILVHEEQLDAASDILASRLSYRIDSEKLRYDISLFAPSGVHLELHFRLWERVDACNAVLSRVWENLIPVEGYSFCRRESPEFFLFHHLAHMAKHLCNGGCGIRPFLDLWLIRKQCPCSEAALRALLEEADLVSFAECAEKLAFHWMEAAPISTTEQALENYVLTGGVYGVRNQKISVDVISSRGTADYILHRAFLPYEELCSLYDWLKGRKYLLPAAEVLRWSRVFQKGPRRRAQREAAITLFGEEQNAAVAALLRDLHLT